MTGNKLFDKILIALNATLILGAVGLVVYSHKFVEKPSLNQSDEFSNMIDQTVNESNKPVVKFDEIVINLYSKQTRLRFISIKMSIETFNSKQVEKLKGLKSIVNDSLIDIVSNMSPDEVNTITGKLLLESRLKKRVNKTLGTSIIRRVYFSKFIVQ